LIVDGALGSTFHREIIWDQITDVLETITSQGAVLHRLPEATESALENALRQGDWDVIHLFTNIQEHEGAYEAIALQSSSGSLRYLTARNLASLISRFDCVKLVVLQVADERLHGCRDLMQTLVDGGVPTCICTHLTAGRAERQFLKSLYSGLVLGYTLRQLSESIDNLGDSTTNRQVLQLSLRVKMNDQPIVSPNTQKLAEPENPIHPTIQPRNSAIRSTTHALPVAPIFGEAIRAASSAPLVEDDSSVECFLCHNSKDKPYVRQIAAYLKQAGYRPWLDETAIQGGEHWQPTIIQAIRKCKAAIVCLGASGVTGWQSLELRTIINEVAERGLIVIPVFLPDAPEDEAVPEFLAQIQCIDLRKAEEPKIEKVVFALRRTVSIAEARSNT
jgi:nucleotide-binding universal stress UspA family protein